MSNIFPEYDSINEIFGVNVDSVKRWKKLKDEIDFRGEMCDEPSDILDDIDAEEG